MKEEYYLLYQSNKKVYKKYFEKISLESLDKKHKKHKIITTKTEHSFAMKGGGSSSKNNNGACPVDESKLTDADLDGSCGGNSYE